MHLAAWLGYTDICLLLIERTDPHIKNDKGQSALDLAIDQQHENCIRVIRSWLAAQSARVALQDIALNRTAMAIGS